MIDMQMSNMMKDMERLVLLSLFQIVTTQSKKNGVELDSMKVKYLNELGALEFK